jgi:hypothetical protein
MWPTAATALTRVVAAAACTLRGPFRQAPPTAAAAASLRACVPPRRSLCSGEVSGKGKVVGNGGASGTRGQGGRAAGAAGRIKQLWAFLDKGTGGRPFIAVSAIAGGIGASAYVAYQEWKEYLASETYAIKQARKRLEAAFATRPESTPIEDVAEEHWVPREECGMKEIETILFQAPGRHVIVGPSGSGKTSTVKMVAREAGRNGVVFVDLKGTLDETGVLGKFAQAFGVNKDKAIDALPLALRAFRDKTGRFATIIIEDAQGALSSRSAVPLLQELANCTEANTVNLVFLSSEGDLPVQLRKMSGWSGAVREHWLHLVDEDTMAAHLVEHWHLDDKVAAEIVKRVGCDMRDVFRSVLAGFKPGDIIDAAVVDARVNSAIEEAKRKITTALLELDVKQDVAARDWQSIQRASVLLLDHLLPRTKTSAVEAHKAIVSAGVQRPPTLTDFEDAKRMLVQENILSDLGYVSAVTWHKRPLREAYAALQDLEDFRMKRKGDSESWAERLARFTTGWWK